ncbi:hypothetical protein BC940DRAFT_333495 [Gongronella butleri]|nr:hypothetical protein BC940DRAFT_333495 [Gongronella butleri]
MDLHSLLNESTPDLSLGDVQALVDADNNEKLRRLDDAVFDVPVGGPEGYLLLDVLVQVLLSITGDTALDQQYARTVALSGLRRCLVRLVRRHGYAWLASYPLHVSDATWQALRGASSSSNSKDMALLFHLYGIVLGAQQRPGVDEAVWADAMLCFLKANCAPLSHHLWVTLCRRFDNNNGATSPVPRRFIECVAAMALRMDVSPTLKLLAKADPAQIDAQWDQFLGAARVKPTALDHQDLMLAKMRFDALVTRSTFPRLFHEFALAELGDTPVARDKNPLMMATLAGEIPMDDEERGRVVQVGLQHWRRLVGSLAPRLFLRYMCDLIAVQYPTDQKSVLDLVLVHFMVMDTFKVHQEAMVDALARLTYHSLSAPFYAFTRVFQYARDVHLASDPLKVPSDMDAERREQYVAHLPVCLSRLLDKMVARVAPEATSWPYVCLQSAPAPIVEHHLTRIIDTVNNDTTDDRLFAHLTLTMSLPFARPLASQLIPLFLHRASFETLDRLLRSKHAALDLFFVGLGADYVDQRVLLELLEERPPAFTDRLVTFLQRPHASKLRRDRQATINAHLIQAMVTLAAQQQEIALRYMDAMLTKDMDTWLAPPKAEKEAPARRRPVLVDDKRTIAVQHTGMAMLVRAIAALDDQDAQTWLTTRWAAQWLGGDDTQTPFSVPVSYVHQCLALFAYSTTPLKAMMLQFLDKGLACDTNHAFLEKLIDVLMLSDAPQLARLTDTLLTRVAHLQGAMHATIDRILENLLACTEKLRLWERTLRLMDEDSSTTDDDENNNDNAFADHALVRKDIKKRIHPGAERRPRILVHRVLAFLARILLCDPTYASPAILDLRAALIATPLLYEPLAHLLNANAVRATTRDTLILMIRTCLDHLPRHDPLYTYSRRILTRIGPSLTIA